MRNKCYLVEMPQGGTLLTAFKRLHYADRFGPNRVESIRRFTPSRSDTGPSETRRPCQKVKNKGADQQENHQKDRRQEDRCEEDRREEGPS